MNRAIKSQLAAALGVLTLVAAQTASAAQWYTQYLPGGAGVPTPPSTAGNWSNSFDALTHTNNGTDYLTYNFYLPSGATQVDGIVNGKQPGCSGTRQAMFTAVFTLDSTESYYRSAGWQQGQYYCNSSDQFSIGTYTVSTYSPGYAYVQIYSNWSTPTVTQVTLQYWQ